MLAMGTESRPRPTGQSALTQLGSFLETLPPRMPLGIQVSRGHVGDMSSPWQGPELSGVLAHSSLGCQRRLPMPGQTQTEPLDIKLGLKCPTPRTMRKDQEGPSSSPLGPKIQSDPHPQTYSHRPLSLFSYLFIF